MFPYRVKYTESESDIQHNDLLYKIDQKCQNTFECLDCLGKNRENQKSVFFKKKRISKLSAFYGDLYGPPLAGLKI